MKVSAIVVTYNRVNLLKKCIHHLLSLSYTLNDIYVVNNCSTDGTKKYLKSINNNKIKSINTNKNLGGAGGFSLGTKIAYENSDSDYFWLMDDDTMPTKSSLFYLLSASSELNNRFGYLCSNVRLGKNEEPSYLNVPIVSKDWNAFVNKGLIKTISASFVSLFIPRRSVHELGLPIADMFIWGDDVEYTTRLSQRFASYFVSNSIVIHESNNNSTNETILNVPMKRLLYYRCMFRNRLFISRKYYKFRRVLKTLAIFLIYLLKIPFMAKNHRVKRFLYALEGIINGFFFNPKIKFPHE